jgi:hypothetical protein
VVHDEGAGDVREAMQRLPEPQAERTNHALRRGDEQHHEHGERERPRAQPGDLAQ